MLLFLTINMAAVTSRANQQLEEPIVILATIGLQGEVSKGEGKVRKRDSEQELGLGFIINESLIRIAQWLHDLWFTSVCRLSSWKTLNSREAGNQFNSTFCSQFRLCTNKIWTFCTVWESLTCSRPISVLKSLHSYIIKSEIIKVQYRFYWTWSTGRIGVICDSKRRENFTADRTSRLYLL